MAQGTSYTHTLPFSTDGLVFFDGRQWKSELTLPGNGPDIYVWMAMEDGGVSWIGSNGAVGFEPALRQSGTAQTVGGSTAGG